MFLAGDDNWVVDGKAVTRGILNLTTNNAVSYSPARHKFQGNVALADGSVQGYSSAGLQEGLRNTGTNVNRIAFP
jgi:prepilin-type processing-associated H-X9-DG protein